MKRTLLSSAVAAWCLMTPVFAASPPAVAPAANDKTAETIKPATACLSDIRAFSDQMQKDGYWLGGSAYGYGYPLDGYGYGYGYPMGGYPPGDMNIYHNARSGYEVRNLLGAANILAQDGQQQTCEAVLATTRDVYKRYAATMLSRGAVMTDGPDWQRQQIAAAQPVTDKTTGFRSDQLIDAAVRDPVDQGLGSVHDIVMDPKTGKIAYLIVARGGVFGFDRKYVPIPWTDFKITQNANLLVLDASKASMDAAPEVSDDQFTAGGHFDQESQKIDAYWKTHIEIRKSGG
jgi:sporulation protein YlmC with PRC-barrel domain